MSSAPPNGSDHSPLILTAPNMDLCGLLDIVGEQLRQEFKRLGITHQVEFGILLWDHVNLSRIHFVSSQQREFLHAMQVMVKNFDKPRVGG